MNLTRKKNLYYYSHFISAKRFVSCLLILIWIPLSILSQNIKKDTLVNVLKNEVRFYMDSLQRRTNPPYFISFRVTDEKKVDIMSQMGTAASRDNRQRLLYTQVRVGSPDLDATSGGGFNRTDWMMLPLDNNSKSLRSVIFQNVTKSYDNAVSQYKRYMKNIERGTVKRDSFPSFASAPVEQYYEEPLPTERYAINTEKWQDRLNEVSSLFRDDPDMKDGFARLEFYVQRKYVVNSEGTMVVQNRRIYELSIGSSVETDDNEICPLLQNYCSYSEEGLPDLEKMKATALDLIQRLKLLKKAPKAEAYSGPAILSGEASGVFFHEIFGHRIEGGRTINTEGGFDGKIGQQVLNPSLTVLSDPTVSTYHGITLHGNYLYDDEGVKAQRVVNVKDGILREFLMSRKPTKDFKQSNGHARADAEKMPVARQSNLIIETSQPHRENELKEMLIREVKRQKKEYGYYFRSVSNGWTTTGGNNSINSFNVVPTEVYRVYADGRPDLMVRGVSLIGTPLTMFSNIKAAGDSLRSFPGYCGAESGWTPVSIVSPMIYVSQVETQQKQSRKNTKKYVVERPENIDTKTLAGLDEGQTVFKAMEDEMPRATKAYKMKDGTPLFRVDYRLSSTQMSEVTSQAGSCVEKVVRPTSNRLSIDVLFGDSMMTSRPFYQMGFFFGLFNQLDYNQLRQALWNAGQNAYTDAMTDMDRKREDVKNHPIPDEQKDIPEILVPPAITRIEPSVKGSLVPPEKLEQLANRLSGVLQDYKEWQDTHICITQSASDNYRLTSQGQKLRYPTSLVRIELSKTGENLSGSTTYWNVCANSYQELPTADTLCARLRAFVVSDSISRHAPKLEDVYIGPIMIAGNLVGNSIRDGIIRKYLNDFRDMGRGNYSTKYQYIGKPVIDQKISVSRIGDMQTYKGIRLSGYIPFDADGVVPGKVQLIENGFLRHQLAGESPSIGCRRSTGNADGRYGYLSFDNRSMFHITSNRTMPLKNMRKRLIKTARKARLDYAYIVRTNGENNEWYRVDVKNGQEQRVNAAFAGNSKAEDMNFDDIEAVSDEEDIQNNEDYYSTLIAPRAMVLKRVKIEIIKGKQEKPSEYNNLRH